MIRDKIDFLWDGACLAVVECMKSWFATPETRTQQAGLPPKRAARRRAVSSAVEHRLYTPAVTGSIPVPPTKESRK